MIDEKREVSLDEARKQNTRERSIFVFMKLRVSDIELEVGDYEMFQLKYKRVIQKAIEEHTEMHVKLLTVAT